MTNSPDLNGAPRAASFLWINLTGGLDTALSASAAGAFDVYDVRETALIPTAIALRAPLFLCFEFDEPDAIGMNAVAHVRRAHPSLPILMIISGHSHAVALWALRIRVWDLLVKPVATVELSQRIGTLIELTQQRRLGPSRAIRFPSQVGVAATAPSGARKLVRTHRVIEHISKHFGQEITLAEVAALCRLSPSRFCHVFRAEHDVSFGQYLLQYRLARACQRLSEPNALAKEVAYAVGFNDLSYFTRAFKRQLGVCPSQYQATARLS